MTRLKTIKNLPARHDYCRACRARQPKNGFAMLFSVLISSLLVVIGLSIFNLTLKELTLSTAARESQAAFYAAHAGLECALYWDFHGDAAGNTAFATFDTGGMTILPLGSAACADNLDVSSSYSSSAGKLVTTAKFNIDSSITNGPCVTITVSKTLVAGKIVTAIESHGNNICGAGRKVERGLRADYNI